MMMIRQLILRTLLALLVGAAWSEVCAGDTMKEAKEDKSPASSDKPLSRRNEVLVEASLLAATTTTNPVAIVNVMSAEAMKDFISFAKNFNIDGEQYFLPDFFKLKYMMLGGLDERGFLAGFYNPFYDTAALLLFDDVLKCRIVGFRVVTEMSPRIEGASLPPAMGVEPSSRYLEFLYKQVKGAKERFVKEYGGEDFRMAFAKTPVWGTNDIARLDELMRIRIGQTVAMATETNLLRDAVLAKFALSGKIPDGDELLYSDKTTQQVMVALKNSLGMWRDSLELAGYFKADGESNILFFTRKMPSFMIQVHVTKGAKVWMKAFDAHIIGFPNLSTISMKGE